MPAVVTAGDRSARTRGVSARGARPNAMMTLKNIKLAHIQMLKVLGMLIVLRFHTV
jgi:hypothetical protein